LAYGAETVLVPQLGVETVLIAALDVVEEELMVDGATLVGDVVEGTYVIATDCRAVHDIS